MKVLSARMLSSASITRCSNPSFKFLEQRFRSAAVSDRALSCAIRSQRQQRSRHTLVGMERLWASAPHHAARPARLSLCPTGLPARLLTGYPLPTITLLTAGAVRLTWPSVLCVVVDSDSPRPMPTHVRMAFAGMAQGMCLKQQELTAMCSTKACHREAALRNRCWWTARKASAWQSWGRVEIMGRQRTKSADLAWPPQFGARPVACKGFGPKGWFVRPRRGSATVASPTKLRRQTNAAGASSRKAVTIPASFDARLQASASRS